MHIPDAAIGSIVAALIGALVVFLGSVLTKEQKTSEFRQVWIDELRNDLASYIGEGYELISLIDEVRKEEKKPTLVSIMTTHHERVEKLKVTETRILLRLNPIEHKEFAKQLTAYFENLMDDIANDDSSTSNENKLNTLRKDRTTVLISASQEVLRKEWKRVKSGEPTFRWTKWTALAIVVIAVLFGSVLIYFEYWHTPSPATNTPSSRVNATAVHP